MNEAKRVQYKSKSSIMETKVLGNALVNHEIPAFQAIPKTAPLKAAKASTTTMILPWCC